MLIAFNVNNSQVVKAAGSNKTTTKTSTIPKGKISVNSNALSVPNSVFTQDTGDWNVYNYGGTSVSKSRQAGGGINGYDHMRLSKGSSSYGDSGMQINITGLQPKTSYTVSAYFRIPIAGTTNGNGLLFVVNGANNAGIASYNRANTNACDWEQVKGTFNTGANASIWLRISTGDYKTVDVTAIKVEKGTVATPVNAWQSSVTYPFNDYNTNQYPSTYEYDDGDYKGTLNAVSVIYTPVSKNYNHDPVYRTDYQTFNKSTTARFGNTNDSNFSSTYYVNENGYSGNIGRTSVNWSQNWETNRWSGTLYGEEYRSSRGNDGGGMPDSKYVTTWDSGTNQTIGGYIPRNGLQLTGTSNEFDYDWGYMWWMSNSNTYYDWNGSSYNKRWSDPPKWPSNKYGHWCQDEGPVSSSGWTQYAVVWSKDVDWSTLQGAPPQRPGVEHKDSPQNGDYGPWWSGDMYNDYRQVAVTYYRRPYTAYNFKGTYSGSISLPNRFIDYTGTAYYSGTLSKQVIDHYNDYYTSTEWNVSVVYSGTTYSYNTTPTAQFTVSTPKLTNDVLSYNDTSTANDPWDSIVAREWSYSYDGKANTDSSKVWSTATSSAPSSFDLSQFSSSLEKGSYDIRLRVKDGGNSLFPGVWSSYAYQNVTIYRRNTKPVAAFTVSPNPQYISYPLTFTDYSSAKDLWDTIVSREWTYSSNGGSTWSTPTSSPPNKFDTPGTYIVRLRVQDKGNLLSPGLWSDPCDVVVRIEDLSVQGEVKHTDTWDQKRIKYNRSKSNTDNSPRGPEVFWPGEKFILKATTIVGARASAVDVAIEGTSFSTMLQETSPGVWEGELWDESMLTWNSRNVTFIFTAHYPYINPLKNCKIIVRIDNNSYLKQHGEF